jgi:integrase
VTQALALRNDVGALARAPVRTQKSLLDIAERWRSSGPTAGRFVVSLAEWLRSLANLNTRRSYAHAVAELLTWLEQERGYVPTPDAVSRDDATRYASWLRTRSLGLDEQRLARDSDTKLEAAIYAFVRTHPATRIDDVRQDVGARAEFSSLVTRPLPGGRTETVRVMDVERTDPAGLDKLLACMTEKKLLSREPSIHDIREGRVHVGVDGHRQARAGIDFRVDPRIFSYAVETHTDARGSERASTIAQRLSALSSFWSHMRKAAGNLPGQGALLTHDIWSDALGDASRLVPSHRRVKRALTTPDMAIFERLLRTTYVQSRDGAVVDVRNELANVRDRALLMLLVYTGARASEIGALRRSDLVGSPPMLTITGKGGTRRMFRLPEPAYAAILDLSAKLEELARAAEKRAPSHEPRQAKLLRDDAPLIPAVVRWGCASKVSSIDELGREKGLTRSALAMMLRTRAHLAGIEPGTPDFARVHPHGFRHLAALWAIEKGVSPTIVQAVLGHSNLATTSAYVEARDPRTISLEPMGAAQAVEPVAPAPIVRPAPQPPPPPRPSAPRRQKPIETVAVEVPEALAPPKPVAAPRPPPPAEPEVPKELRLVQVGEVATPAEAASKLALDNLGRIYDERWGERSDSQQLHRQKDDPEDLLQRAFVGRKSGLVWWTGPLGQLVSAMPVVGPDQLTGTDDTADIRAGLEDLWMRWATDAELDKSGRHVPRGPTAARALLSWLFLGLTLTDQVDSDLKSRDGVWVVPDAPWPSTSLRGDLPATLRMHLGHQVVRWYGSSAYKYLESRGETTERRERRGMVLDAPVDLPAYYDALDPIADLPDDERDDLLDWLRVMTGKSPTDKKPRFALAADPAPSLRKSRSDLAMLLSDLCSFDVAADDVGDAKRALRKRQGDKEELEERVIVGTEGMRRIADAIAKRVSTLTAGKIKDFNIEALRDARVAKTKAARVEAQMAAARSAEQRAEIEDEADEAGRTREKRREFYMDVLRQLYGDAAAEDPLLRLFALCRGNQPFTTRSLPLGSGNYAALFRVDSRARTIVHDKDFARDFAHATGAHSECVARRVARDMWELRKAHFAKLASRDAAIEAAKASGDHAAMEAAKKLPRGERLIRERPDEFILWVETLAAYRVPCPTALETELRDRLGGDAALVQALPLKREWERRREAAKAAVEAPRSRREVAEAMLEDVRRGEEGAREREARRVIPWAGQPEAEPNRPRVEYVYHANALPYLPGPVTLLCALWLR